MHTQRGRYLAPGEFDPCPETRASSRSRKRTLETGTRHLTTPPAKRKCKHCLTADVINKEIPEYYGGRCVGPGILSHVQYLGISWSYQEITKKLHLHYRFWIQQRKLPTCLLLLVPSWTGFFIEILDNIVIIPSTIRYLDMLDSPATDLKTAYEVPHMPSVLWDGMFVRWFFWNYNLLGSQNLTVDVK